MEHIFISQVWNFAGLYTSLASDPFVFDSSPPESGIVRDDSSKTNVIN